MSAGPSTVLSLGARSLIAFRRRRGFLFARAEPDLRGGIIKGPLRVAAT